MLVLKGNNQTKFVRTLLASLLYMCVQVITLNCVSITNN